MIRVKVANFNGIYGNYVTMETMLKGLLWLLCSYGNNFTMVLK